ncbi:hypothetical protein NKH14_26810 [Mesorhizobium sp. M1380]|uniref:hypothetical protein n=1 Tax=Mesorhizobium sp. M1380 TaxID=2957093 RepID=UPI0033383C83
MIEGADRALDRWNQNQTQEVREASIASYIETGEIDHAAAGINELEASIVQAAAAVQIERQVLKPVGLSMDQWLEHVDEADLPAFRRAVVEGDWQALINHARAAAKMRLDLGI